MLGMTAVVTTAPVMAAVGRVTPMSGFSTVGRLTAMRRLTGYGMAAVG